MKSERPLLSYDFSANLFTVAVALADMRRSPDQSDGIYNSYSMGFHGIHGNVNQPCPQAIPSDSVGLLP